MHTQELEVRDCAKVNVCPLVGTGDACVHTLGKVYHSPQDISLIEIKQERRKCHDKERDTM